jgi:hypothetical protein
MSFRPLHASNTHTRAHTRTHCTLALLCRSHAHTGHSMHVSSSSYDTHVSSSSRLSLMHTQDTDFRTHAHTRARAHTRTHAHTLSRTHAHTGLSPSCCSRSETCVCVCVCVCVYILTHICIQDTGAGAGALGRVAARVSPLILP